jgi:asparagine synthase (glutamine-hydrolysing)
MGFGRLAIVGGESGKQPVSDAPARIWCAFTGEIYNVEELRRELASLHSLSEAQVILELYRREGVRGLRQLDGEYSIVLVDLDKSCCIVVRDPVGIRPAYYAALGGDTVRSWLVATSLDAFFRHPDFTTALDEQTLAEHWALGFSSCSRTPFEHIRAVPPGHYLTVPLDGQGGDPRVARLDELSESEDAVACSRPEQLFADVRGLLFDAVRTRIAHVDRGPIGLALSGGIDSSLLACVVAGLSPDGILAVTLDDGAAAEDSRSASTLTECLGMPHAMFSVAPSEFLEHFARMVLAGGGASPSFSAYMLGMVLQRSAPEIRVVLGGDGADELFLGYRLHVDPRRYLAQLDTRMRGIDPSIVQRSELLLRASSWNQWPLDRAWNDIVVTFQRDQLVTSHLLPCDHGLIAHGIEYRVPYLSHVLWQFARKHTAALRALGPDTKLLLRLMLVELLGEKHRTLARSLISRQKVPAHRSMARAREHLQRILTMRGVDSALGRMRGARFAEGSVERFWIACMSVVFLKHRGNIHGLGFDELVQDVLVSVR